MTNMQNHDLSSAQSSTNDPMSHADIFGDLLLPVAQLALAQGVKLPELVEQLKFALVQAAVQDAQEFAPKLVKRTESAISVATGVHRKDVHRLLQQPAPSAKQDKSIAPLVFTRWRSYAEYLDENGHPMPLARDKQGEDPMSFDALCAAVSRDVHPRTVLEELKRLGLIEEREGGFLQLTRTSYVPEGDSKAMLSMLVRNVGDHLRAATHNVLAPKPRFFEQALYAQPMKKDAIDATQHIVRKQWQSLLKNSVPKLSQAVDIAKQEENNQADDLYRVRLGMYVYYEKTDVNVNEAKHEN
jgi:Family of unknown function (DUF6502)